MGAEDQLIQLIIDELKRLQASTENVVIRLGNISTQIATLEAQGQNVTELKEYVDKLRSTLTLKDLAGLKIEAQTSREFRLKLYTAAAVSGASGYGIVELIKSIIP